MCVLKVACNHDLGKLLAPGSILETNNYRTVILIHVFFYIFICLCLDSMSSYFPRLGHLDKLL